MMNRCILLRVCATITSCRQALGIFVCLTAGVSVQLSHADTIETDVKAAAVYRFGDSRQAWDRIEKRVAAVAFKDPERQELASRLVSMLGSDATVEAQQQACTQLSLIGGKAEVPILARQLLNTNLSYYARQALERISDESATLALAESATKAEGVLKLDIIRSLGVRRDPRIIADLVTMAKSRDPQTLSAVIDALAKMGNKKALDGLSELEQGIPDNLRSQFAEAMLRNIQSLSGNERLATAKPLLKRLVQKENPASIRTAAYVLYWQLAGSEVRSEWIEALTSQDSVAQSAALRSLHRTRNIDWFNSAMESLDKLSPHCQLQVISLAEEIGTASNVPKLTPFASASNKEIAHAAIKALGGIGNETTIQVLSAIYSKAIEADRKLIVEAWARLRGSSVETQMLASLKNAPAPIQVGLIRALVIRDCRTAATQFLDLCKNDRAEIRREALKALGAVGSADLCAPLIALMSSDKNDIGAIEEALSGICRRTRQTDAILKALSDSKPDIQASLLNVLAAIGEKQSKDTIAQFATGSSGEVQRTAVRLLSEWPDPSPLEDLVKVAVQSSDSTVKALAVRGAARHAAQAKDRSQKSVVELLVQLLNSGAALNETKTVISALGELRSWESLKVLVNKLTDPELANEAAHALIKILESANRQNRTEAQQAIERIIASSCDSSLKEQAKSMLLRFGEWSNLCIGAVADSPDGLDADGQAGSDQAAIDGKMETYWDEVDNQKLYRLRIQFKQKAKVVFIRIIGWKHQEYAPRDFEILCDDKTVKSVKDAVYQNNQLTVEIPPTTCANVELKITRSYAASPAIRELEIYGKFEDE